MARPAVDLAYKSGKAQIENNVKRTGHLSFTAVDFETSAWKHDSACAVGAVQVRDGQIVDSYYSLLKPPPSPYWNYVETHGITREMVKDAPTFPEVWPRLMGLLAGGPLVAHNVGFDWDVLTQTLQHYRMPQPELDRVCTIRLARRGCPGLASYSLPAVAAHFGIALNHHHAASDAHACAEVVMRLWRR